MPLLVNWTIVGRRTKAHEVFLVAASGRDCAALGLGLLLRELHMAGGQLVSRSGSEIAMVAAWRVICLVVIMLLHLTSSTSWLNFGVLSMLVDVTLALLSRRRVMSVSLVSLSIGAGRTTAVIFSSAIVTTLFPSIFASIVTSVTLKVSVPLLEPALSLDARLFSFAFSFTTLPSRIFGGKDLKKRKVKNELTYRSTILEELYLTKDCYGSTLLLLERSINGHHYFFSVGVILRAADSNLGARPLHELLN